MLNQLLYAQAPPAGFSSVVVSSQWNEAVGVTFSTNGQQMFVWERTGKVWIVENGQKYLLLDISEEVGGWHDHGLLGFVLHPQYEQNGYVYVFYLVDRHHLINYGTGAYNPLSNSYFNATIARLTRYTAIKTSSGYTATNRKILLGQTKSTGVPSLSRSHVTGSLVFGSDGTLLIATGDGATSSAVDVGGSNPNSYAAQAITDGIITSTENVGAFRAQLVGGLNGKILRIDPETGMGIPSNPFYDPQNPSAARSKVWALGLRNPFRMALKPFTGSLSPADGNPGVLYIGDVGYFVWEEINIADKPGLNFGWPMYEGLTPHTGYSSTKTYNFSAPNPLYGVNGCTQPYFYFQDLLKQATASGTSSFTNPCLTSQTIPSSVPTFMHARPAIEWNHGTNGPARTGIFNGETAATIAIGAAGSPISGKQFGGISSTGGVFYTGNTFPASYKNTYFHGDYGKGWIKNITVDGNHKPTSVQSFIDSGAVVVSMAVHPVDGSLYYVNFGNEIRRVYYSANRPPKALATSNKTFGPAPLSVQFTGSNSSDPDGEPLSYEWNFGDGTTSTAANPSHTYYVDSGAPTKFTVTLKVRDPHGITDQVSLFISANNTPPQVTITSPANNSLYLVSTATTYPLKAQVIDVEHNSSQLTYQWQTTLHHNDHIHPEPVDSKAETSITLDPLGCDGDEYYYSIRLTVTDIAGLQATSEVKLYPECQSLAGNVSNLNARALNTQVQLSWTNPANAFDEVMIVAKSGTTITGIPAGNGSAYTADLNFTAPASTFNGGKVVYKGKVAPQTVTGLTNNTTYFFKVFTRTGSSWSEGVQINASPFAPIVREYWAGIPGTGVTSIPVNTPPTSTSQLFLFEGPINAAENYGSRIRAFIHAPASGNYTFWIASDDNSELWLSTDENPELKKKIAFVSGWTNQREWNKFSSQQSIPIPLEAGKKFYIEVLHKEGVVGDNLAVGWSLPNNTLERPIPGSRLSPYITISTNQLPIVSISAPASNTSFPAPASITIQAQATDADGSVSKVEFFQGSTKLGEDSTSPYSFTWSNFSQGSYLLTAKATDNSGATATSAIVAVTVGSTPAVTSIFRAINLNGPSVSIDNIYYEASATAADFSYSGMVFTNQAVPLNPVTDASRSNMIRSSIFSLSYKPASLAITSVPTGTYEIFLYVWEDNNTEHYTLTLEGQTIISNYSTGAAGSWAKLGPFRTYILDGTCNLTASGGAANLSGIELWKVTPSAAKLSGTAESVVHETIRAYPNPFSDEITVQFQLPYTNRVRIGLYDARGNLLHTLYQQAAEEGILYTICYKQHGLPDGLYVISLATQKDVFLKKVMLIK